MTPATRYAIFFAPPPESALWRFGSSVLGYDAATGLDVDQFVPASVAPATWHALTEEPRRYGFHATLKAPFRLANELTEADLLDAVSRYARSAMPVDVALDVSQLGDFIALVPSSVPAGLAALERSMVTTFDRFRAPLNETERIRRRRASLTPRQHQYLERYGYPYVLEEFRFHMTLSGRLPTGLVAGVIGSLKDAYTARCPAPVAFDRTALFREFEGRFRVMANIAFG